MRDILILTCTVEPQTEIKVQVSSPQERILEYCKAINFYLSKLKSNVDIAIIENSNNIESLRLQYGCSRVVCFLQLSPDKESKIAGKSAGEFKMLKEFADQIEITQYRRVWKVTGHLIVENISRIISNEYKDDIVAYRFTRGASSDSRFFGMSPQAFQSFVLQEPRFSEQDTFFSMENGTYKSMEYFLEAFLINAEQNRFRVGTPREIPYFIGRSLSTGKTIIPQRRWLLSRIQGRFRKIAALLSGGYQV